MLAQEEIAAVRSLSDRAGMVNAYFYGKNGLVKLDKAQESPTAQAEPVEVGDEYAQIFSTAAALEPPYPPDVLCKLVEHSCALRQNIDAYRVNIDGFGFRWEPSIDLDGSDADERIADSLFARAVLDVEAKIDSGDIVLAEDQTAEDLATEPSDSEVATRKKQLVKDMRREKARIDHFFKFCARDVSFVEMRKMTRQDIETLGNGYWEVIRTNAGKLSQFAYVSAFTVRLMPLDERAVDQTLKIKYSALDYTEVTSPKRFRRFAQVFNTKIVFFKEYGDRRVLSRTSGNYYATLEALKAAEPEGVPANEMLHFKIHSPRTPYGIPRWIGTLLAVLGTRASEEVNYLYFENKSVPPLALLVSGGRINDKTVDRIASYIENEIKGKRNFHNILVLEAEPAAQTSPLDSVNRMRIELRPLTAAQHNDALFQNYDERNVDKVGQSFRLPRLLRGDSRDQNRATALAALTLAESQVFAPEREDFDHMINFRIMPELNARFFMFKSKGAVTTNPSELATILDQLVKAKILTINESRQIAEGVVLRELRRLEAEWADMPADLLDPKTRPLAPPGKKVPDEFESEYDDVEKGDVSTGDLAEGGAISTQQPPKKPKKKPIKKKVVRGQPMISKNDQGEIVETWHVPQKVWDTFFKAAA